MMTDGEIEDLRLNFKEFLSGDIWTLAVDDLLEMNCIYFEPNNANDGKEQKSIWANYRTVVAAQIDYFLEIFGVSDTRLKSIIRSKSAANDIDTEKLYQVLAGENTEDGFNLFVNLMVTRRLQLDRMTAQVLNELAEKEHRLQQAIKQQGAQEDLKSGNKQSLSKMSPSSPSKQSPKSTAEKESKVQYVDDQEAINRILSESANDVVMPNFKQKEEKYPKLTPSASPAASPLDSKSAGNMSLSDLSLVPPVLTSASGAIKSPTGVASSSVVPPVGIFMEREASSLMVDNLKKEEEKAKVHLQSSPFSLATAPPLSSVSSAGDSKSGAKKDFLSTQIHQANVASKASFMAEQLSGQNYGTERAASTSVLQVPSETASSTTTTSATVLSSSPSSEEDKSNRFVDLRKQLMEKKAKMRDDKAETLNVPERMRPSSARQPMKESQHGKQTPKQSQVNASQSSENPEQQSSRNQVRKNIFASVRDEVMER
ncbi:uncharacterized protein LOC142351466 [Convolutriloba macropyga]|uniref:uncharacterized protein LOC142351466 n=1 Tax=Convolutriloba macropyga TaxID=536237 RepID=UPI003F51BFB7